MLLNTCESKFYSYKNRGLGEGAFGHVFEACLEGAGCSYAVKIQNVTGRRDFTQINNMISISQMMGEMGIGPKIYETFLCDDPELFFREDLQGLSLEMELIPGYIYYPEVLAGTYLFIIMEKLQGMTLEKYLQAGYRLQDVFDPIVDTIEEMHVNGVIHGDLKSDNIYIQNDGAIRILDFGASTYYPDGVPIPLQEKDKTCTGPYIWKHDFKQFY